MTLTQNNLSHRSVLIVDDDEDILLLFKLNLEKLVCEVITELDGEKAIEIYQNAFATEHPIDVLIVDLNIIGGLGGKEITAAVRNIDPHATIIVASGDTAAAEMLKPQDYGFDAILHKDFNFENIKQVLDQVLMPHKAQ